MGTHKLEDLKIDTVKHSRVIDDPEIMTHYLGNDEYLELELDEPEATNFDGFFAGGNEELRMTSELTS